MVETVTLRKDENTTAVIKRGECFFLEAPLGSDEIRAAKTYVIRTSLESSDGLKCFGPMDIGSHGFDVKAIKRGMFKGNVRIELLGSKYSGSNVLASYSYPYTLIVDTEVIV